MAAPDGSPELSAVMFDMLLGADGANGANRSVLEMMCLPPAVKSHYQAGRPGSAAAHLHRRPPRSPSMHRDDSGGGDGDGDGNGNCDGDCDGDGDGDDVASVITMDSGVGVAPPFVPSALSQLPQHQHQGQGYIPGSPVAAEQSVQLEELRVRALAAQEVARAEVWGFRDEDEDDGDDDDEEEDAGDDDDENEEEAKEAYEKWLKRVTRANPIRIQGNLRDTYDHGRHFGERRSCP